MKIAAILLCTAGLLAQQRPEREGNFNIRFEPTAKLQTGVQVPFRIAATDDLNKPLVEAKVTLQVGLNDDTRVKVYPAPAISPGVYIAKPVFPVAGEWKIYVEVRRTNKMSARTVEFTVPD